MASNSACEHITAIDTVKHPKRRECEECVKMQPVGCTCGHARTAARRCAATAHPIGTHRIAREAAGTA